MFKGALDGFLDLLYPRVCLSCRERIPSDAENKLVCEKCLSNIRMNTPPFCSSCGRRLERNNILKNICPACSKTRHSFDRAFAPCVYDGVIKELIHEFKYKGKDHLGESLSRIMIDFIREFSLPMDFVDFIVPVPLHPARLREREFNQAEVLSRHIGEEFKKDLLSDILKRHRHTRTQTDLEHTERMKNVKGSFSLAKQYDIRGKNFLLVDDVMTSGATSSEAAQVLKDAGAQVVFVLTLAS